MRSSVFAALVAVALSVPARAEPPPSRAPRHSSDKPGPAPRSADARRLIRAKPFPAEARKVLNERMQQHGTAMEDLIWSALVLDYDGIDAAADGIARAPRIERPGSGPQDPLTHLLPEQFFELQDQLTSTAIALTEAGQRRDDDAIAREFGRLGATCMSCHSLYLRIQP